MTPGRLDLEVPRNGSDTRTLQLFTHDENGGDVVIDISGMTVEVIARDVFGGEPVATADAAIIDGPTGKITLSWLGSDFDDFGDRFADAVAAWDLKLVDLDGIPTVPARGLLHITPEATA